MVTETHWGNYFVSFWEKKTIKNNFPNLKEKTNKKFQNFQKRNCFKLKKLKKY